MDSPSYDDEDDDYDRRDHRRGDRREERSRRKGLRSFLKGDSKAKKTVRANDDYDDVLNQMLLDVPASEQPIASAKPLKPKPKPSRASSDARSLSPLPTKRTKLEEDEPKVDNGDDVTSPIGTQELDEVFDCPISCVSEGNTTQFYWYDCCEDAVRNPGVVYLFGRTYASAAKRFVSCCAIIKNFTRTVYLMIADDSNYDQAVGEFTHITAKRLKIKGFTCEKVTKKYAFSSDPKTPLVADYVKVEYPANQPALPADLMGETFTRVLNVNQTPMEKFILDMKLRGPCWLRLVDPAIPNGQLTWSKTELVLESPANVIVEENQESMKAPYFCAFSLAIRTYPNPITHHNEIIAIAGMVNTTFNLDECLKRTNKASGHFLLMAKPAAGHKELKLPYDFHLISRKYKRTKFEILDSERDLLTTFMDKFNEYDPDIVIGHDLLNFDYETLVMRMRVLKVGVWSRLGRFKRTELPSTKAAFRYMFSGRVMCDIRVSAMELIKSRSYDLTELASNVLKKSRVEYSYQAIVSSFKTSESLVNMLDATWEDNDSIFSILVELNVIPLALKITNITGNILSRTLAAGRSERNEYLLLHAFHEDNFICPEKQISSKFGNKRSNNKAGEEGTEASDAATTGRRKAAYTGGLVLEPKAGYYDTCVLLMDFNSLYPSIIQEFNICFSTIQKPQVDGSDPGGELIAGVPDESVSTGILPAQLRNLVDRRRQVKRLLAECKSDNDKMMLDIEQKALKLTANSMYGCLGFEQSRFYAKHLASLVTFKGREILMSTKAMVERLGYEVIYGDTDSLMINTKLTDYDEVIQRGTAIKGEINRTFKLLEIDIDGVYRPLLLLKKKNYAGAIVSKGPDGQIKKSVETKGLDTVRRDRAVIAKEAGEKVLNMILRGEKDIDQTVEDIHAYLRELGDDIRAGRVDNRKFLISKQLARNPEEYKDIKSIGHVALAIRHNADPKNIRKMKAGDTVEYVVCTNNTSDSGHQRGYTLAELANSTEANPLAIDQEYYLCQQIHPVMARICDKLPVTNAYVLAEMLGIEKSSLLHIKRDESDNTRRDQLISKGESRFNSCKPLEIVCPNCNQVQQITSRLRKCTPGNQTELSLTSCSECGVRYAMRAKLIVCQVIALIRRMTLELYNTKWVCESSDCDHWTRNLFGPLTSDTDAASNSTGGAAAGGAGGSALKAQPACDRCEASMVPEMDDRKMDLQLGYLRHLFDVQRELHVPSKSLELQTPSDDVIEMYRMCFREVEHALRCSFINNIDAYTMFSMISSGRPTSAIADSLVTNKHNGVSKAKLLSL